MKLARRLAGVGRIVIAVGLLAALWVGTVTGVQRASRAADDRRAGDRAAVAAGFAASIRQWLDSGRSEATSLSRLAATGGQGAIESFIAATPPPAFTRDAIVMQGTQVVAASPHYAVLVGLEPKPCTTNSEIGPSTDTTLQQIVAAARPEGAPVVSRIFLVPGNCRDAAVGIAVSDGTSVTVVLGSVGDAAARLTAGSLIGSQGTRVTLIADGTTFDSQLGPVPVPPRVAAFVRDAAADGPQRVRAGDVLDFYASVGDGWSVVLEQDAAAFDIELQSQPSVIVASVLTVVFAIVFALIAFFDIRRRRAHRRAEVAKNAFFSVAGHELRTPLTVLKGFSEMLAGEWDDLDDDSRRLLVERMLPQTRRLDRLVERLLVAASIAAETHTRPQVEPVDVVPILESVAEHFRPEAPLHTIVVQAGSGAVHVRAEARALDQVAQHLVDNAVKYSPTGGHVWIRVVPRGRSVDILIEDEGIGLPSDYRSIFDKFSQGESVTKRVHDEGGVGLGLYIVRTLVQDMGGSVRAEPRTPEGARFVVTLRSVESIHEEALNRSNAAS